MINEISSIKLHGANFYTSAILPLLDSSDGKITKLSLVYGRNGSGKSTIAKAFRKIKGEAIWTVDEAVPLGNNNAAVLLSDEEKERIFVFDEDFVTQNVRVEENGLGSIVMLGKQADLTDQIESVERELQISKEKCDSKRNAFDEYLESDKPKAPQFYINKMKKALSSEKDCWAEQERIIKNLRRNASVNDETYKQFINLKPERTRNELVDDLNRTKEELSVAQSGKAKIEGAVPVISPNYKIYDVDSANELLKRKIERPELSDREKYLLSLVATKNSEDIHSWIVSLGASTTTYCPYCLRELSTEYKEELVCKIEEILVDEENKYRNQLRRQILQEVEIELSSFSKLTSFDQCVSSQKLLNEKISHNNELLQRKLNNVYVSVIDDELLDISDYVKSLEKALQDLEEEKRTYNGSVVNTKPIIEKLISINNAIAYYDVIDDFKQYEKQSSEMEIAKKAYDDACKDQKKISDKLEELNSKRKRIDIAIDIINNGLKYIFFSEDRLSIRQENGYYVLFSNGKPVAPKNVSVGERNIIGLCYFFASILREKNEETAYDEEYCIVIDDPVSSFDFENRVGILSFLKYKLGQFLTGSSNTKAIIFTHDLLTMFDLEKIAKELNDKWKFFGKAKYLLFELKDCSLVRFGFKDRQEYTELLKTIYEYGRGKSTENDIVIGNIMRQALEAFATFEYRKGIEAVSTDDFVLNSSDMDDELKAYFKNLMYRLVLNSGSHREEQTRSLRLDFLSVISENEKRRTAQEVLCFIYMLNKPHLLSHLGNVNETLEDWCKTIKSRAVSP